ncbi:MAG: MlrC C-terminal domain-containing protein, partial [Planctomycetes bacterium]|nr:MlrC C-terminal domain-containing protein [Planctomycetota bacterium]
LLPIVDAPAAAAAHAAGIGGQICIELGGSCDTQFSPLSLDVEITALSDGMINNESHGGFYDAGPTAVVQYKNICIVIISKAIHLFDRSLFIDLQINVKDFDIVVVKSPHTQYEFFSAWAQATYIIDVPGATSAKLQRLGHQLCQRPIFPLDEMPAFIPQTRTYS